MKKILLLFLILLAQNLQAKVYYVATNGNDDNPGTFADPWVTWQKGFDAAHAGDTVYLRGGVYYTAGILRGGQCIGVSVTSKSGSAEKPVTIQAYPGETPVLDGSPMTANARRRGIHLSNCSHFVLRGLTVRNVREYGQFPGCPLAESISMARCSHIHFEGCTVHDCGNGFGTSGFCDQISFVNCDAYNNIDFSDNGGYANGWTLTMYLSPGVYASGTHVTLKGCRSWGNSDDGYDMFGANGYFEYTDCWAFDNGRYDGNGDGFKSHQKGEIESGIQRTYIRCLSFHNKGSGFTSPPQAIESLINCVSYGNGLNGFGYNTGKNLTCIFRNNISFENKRSQYAGLPDFINENNSWNKGFKAGRPDFISLDTTGVSGIRLSSGALPELGFLKLREDSGLIDAGTDAGLPFSGNAPDLGAREFTSSGVTNLKTPGFFMIKMYLSFLLPWL